jgi:hypothetical protein
MTNTNKNLEQLLSEGFLIHKKPMVDYEPCDSKYAVPMANLETGDKVMLCFDDEVTYNKVCEIVDNRPSNPFEFKGTVERIDTDK